MDLLRALRASSTGCASAARLVLALLAAGLMSIGCGARNTVQGVVEKVDPEHGMVLIAHAAVPELLPEGETGFRVPNEALLGTLEPGQVGRVVFAESNGGYVLLDFGFERWVTPDEGWIDLGGTRVRTDPAPELALIDHEERSFELGDLAGHAVLLGFIYTQCPGPCPIQTSDHMAVRRGLSDETAAKTWFVMVTIDPARDDAAALREYKEAHGVDYENWTFLTGPVETVLASNQRWGITSTFVEDGSIEHMQIVYLLDGRGRIVKRYIGAGQDPKQMIRDMQQVVAANEAARPKG